MLSAHDNEALTRVGAGTPMGELLRRYWHPVAASSALTDGTVVPVRLLGEDLALFRGLDAQIGLVDRRCPHRSADLSMGFVDSAGLRCSYHGWAFDAEGHCVAQPFDDLSGGRERRRSRARIGSYQVAELAGLVWAYLGPLPAPILPCWEPFTWPHGFRQIVFATVDCNWLQCQENSIDPVHFEWLHDNWGAGVLRGRSTPYEPAHLRLGFDEFEHGFVYRRVRADSDETGPLWTVGRVCLWPAGLYTGDHIEWRVPVDDEHTLSVCWMYDRVPADREPFDQEEIPAWTGPVYDPATGRPYLDHIMNQDFAAWLGQGVIADRTSERLGRSDAGIAAIRRRFLRDFDAIARGEDPKGVLRGPESARFVELPTANRADVLTPPTREQLRERHSYWERRGAAGPFIYQAGQPAHVRRAYYDAMGLPDTDR